ncbi:NAD(P)H oxidoreductase [Enterobacteriaceae bacterium H11S18]|uniref:NAD(P)H oxidoreductase n=1 Tax=Dryocola clanedunensis TaxID=2925396 RepID=UPI0022F05C47|nr:NAD(P)H oxidoreductase [Dryocola clanedunensis]MCT4704864.1 NAD(P)H oxidoreductase [Dryocola clanedunensis]MCT4712014.1 NAD(P)H oxidoreductase [Dryocola clanedunensis]
MKENNMYIVWAHPRSDSLTAQVVNEIQGEAQEKGMKVATLDLYRIGFNPALDVADEPDWDNPNKQYSPEVHRLFNEMADNDTIVMVFPVWWYGFPAMLKGYLDRVWNNGLAYGGKGFPAKRVHWVALVGGSEEGYVKYGWEKNMSDYLNSAGGYLGIAETRITYLYNTIGVEEDITDSKSHYETLFEQARGVVAE